MARTRDARGRFTKATPVEYADWSVGWYVRGEHITMGEDWHPTMTRRAHRIVSGLAVVMVAPLAIVLVAVGAVWLVGAVLVAIGDLFPSTGSYSMERFKRDMRPVGWMTGAVPAWRLGKVATKGAAGLAVGATIVAID